MRAGYKLLIGAALIAGGGYLIYRFNRGRDISKAGLSFLKKEEGSKDVVYPDSRGLPTGGVGHLITAKDLKTLNATPANVIGKPVPSKLSSSWLNADLDRFEKTVRDTIKVPLKQYQRDALLSLAFNIGETGFKNSSLAKKINSGKASPSDIQAAFLAWSTPSVLTARRKRESQLFLTGHYA